jgi:hypothetical protein
MLLLLLLLLLHAILIHVVMYSTHVTPKLIILVFLARYEIKWYLVLKLQMKVTGMQ